MTHQTVSTLFSVLVVTLTAHAATRVDLVVDEPYPERNVTWPVTTGVPFPRGSLTDVRHCRLIDDLGTEQPLQARVAATWDAQGSSIRWLTIHFLALPDRGYALEYGNDVLASKKRTALHVVEGNSSVRVSTGPLAVRFSTDGASLLKTVQLDLDADGRTTADEVVMVGPTDGEHYYVDQDDRQATSAGDHSYRRLVVETTGPIRACVRVDGAYARPNGQSIVRYRTRYHFFSGLSLIKIVDEFRIVGSTHDTKFREIGLRLAWPNNTRHRSVSIDGDGAQGDQVVSVDWRDSTRSVSSFQATYRHFGNEESAAGVVHLDTAEERLVHRSERVGEWLQVRNNRVAVTGSLRWMWQQFPKAWHVTNADFAVHLWSERGGDLDFSAEGIRKFLGEAGREYLLDWRKERHPRNPVSQYFYYAGQDALARDDADGRGINKHHELWLHFAPADEGAVGQEYGRLAAKQPLAIATPEWNCASDVFGPLMPRAVHGQSVAPTRSGLDASPYEAVVDRLFDLGRYAQEAFGDYGWTVFGSGPHYSYQWDEKKKRHYADPARFEYHTYQKETQLWWNYVRSGQRKFFDWAIPSENHWVDIATTHVPLKYRCAWRGGSPQDQVLHFRPGDWSIDSPLFHVRQRDSAEAWLRGGSQFWASYHRTLETTTLAYYLTGDERYNDVLKFWRQYWSVLAGKTSASEDVPVWIQEQPWFEATEPGEPTKSWAEMIRDYSPFTSGLRHQMTQLFNLATLYEHTWDPAIGQVLRECADVYLDSKSRIGVWSTQENALPAFADAPKLAHFWVPALWKYARVTEDPRMKQIFRNYFKSCYTADPFREDVGRYSNVHIGYAYYYTRDPRHLRPALNELEAILPFGTPLKGPEELRVRLYNPHVPIRCLTAIPRLLWALDASQRDGVTIPPPAPVKLQRSPIALWKPISQTLAVTLWGHDQELTLFDPAGERVRELDVTTERHASDMQPFDRTLPEFEVFLHELTLPRTAPAGYYVLSPRIGLAVLTTHPSEETRPALVNASRPVALSAGERFHVRAPQESASIEFESAAAAAIQVFGPAGERLNRAAQGNRVTVPVKTASRDAGAPATVTFHNSTSDALVWLRLVGLAPHDSWGSFNGTMETTPNADATNAALPPLPTVDPTQFYASGRFGQAAHIVPGRQLELPDHVDIDGVKMRLFNLQQGTIEFFVKKLWDDRLVQPDDVEYLTNGLLSAWCPRPLPIGEWAHVAVEWRPLKRDPKRQVVHIYVDGLDRAYYRSTWWEGYTPPLTFRKGTEWLRRFVSATRPNAPFLIDELRISTIARYAQLDVTFGREQTYNPARFHPPSKPFQVDPHTAALFHLDRDASGISALVDSHLVGTLREEK